MEMLAACGASTVASQLQLHATIKETRNRKLPRNWHPAPRGRQLQGSILGGYRGSQAPAACHKFCASANTVRGTPKGRRLSGSFGVLCAGGRLVTPSHPPERPRRMSDLR